MYFITSMNSILTEKTDFRSEEATNHVERCFGYYPEKEDAFEAVRRNSCDMHETMYDYIVVEEIEPGIHGMAEVVGWFKYNRETDGYDPIEVGRTGFCNYAIG